MILQYRELEKRNQDLTDLISQKEASLKSMQEHVERLQKNYANLKLAKMIEIGDDDLKDAKTRLSKLVREVDKCIALLNL